MSGWVLSVTVLVFPGLAVARFPEQVWVFSVHETVLAGQAEPQPEYRFCQVPSQQR